VASLVLLDRAGATILLRPEHEDAFGEEKVTLARAMATL
jgi:hypothetical protein